MSTTHKLSLGGLSVTTLLSTGLNSLTNGSRAVSGADNNDTDLALYGDFECNFGSAAFGSGAFVSLYILESVDGTNYEDGDASTTPASSALLCNIMFRNATAAQIHAVRGIPLPPTKFKILLINNTGVTLASSGNTLKMQKYYEQDV